MDSKEETPTNQESEKTEDTSKDTQSPSTPKIKENQVKKEPAPSTQEDVESQPTSTEAPRKETPQSPQQRQPEPKQEQQHQPKQQQPQPQQMQQQQQQQQGGGWSIGSWWSAASNVVTQSVEQYVKPTVSSLTETTKGIVQELIADEPAPNTDSQQQQPDQQQQPQQPVTQPVDLKLFSVVDKGFTMLGESVDVLGNYLHQGIELAKTADLQKAKTIATTSLEKAKQVAVHTTEKGLQVGEKLAQHSVDALESVGKTALEYLTVQEDADAEGNKKRIRPVFYYIPQMTKEQSESFEEALNKNYFEENHGPAHMQALENLSIECTLDTNKAEQQLDPKQREQLSVLVNKIKSMFDAEDEEEENKPEIPDVKLNEPAVKHGELLEALTQESIQKANELLQAFRQDINSLRPESIIGSVDICHLTASYLDKTLVESAKRLSQLSAISIEQLLRIVESVLIASDGSSVSDDQEALKKAIFLFAISQKLADDLSNASNSFIDCLRSLAAESRTTFQEYGNRSDKDSEESKKCTEDIDTKTNLHVNHLYLDSSNAVSNIQDCRKFLFPISKSLLVKGIKQQSQPQQQEQSSSSSSSSEAKEAEKQ